MEQKLAVTKWEHKVKLVQTAKEPDEDEISAFQDRLNRLGDEAGRFHQLNLDSCSSSARRIAHCN